MDFTQIGTSKGGTFKWQNKSDDSDVIVKVQARVEHSNSRISLTTVKSKVKHEC